MRKIAFIHEHFPFGGAEVVTRNVISSLSGCGYKFYIFTNSYIEENDNTPINNVNIITVNCDFNNKNAIDYISSCVSAEGIELIVVKDFYSDLINKIKSVSDCKVVYIHHSAPFWESIFKKENGKHYATKSAAKWLEWNLLRSIKFKLGLFDKKLVIRYSDIYNNVDAFAVLCDNYAQEFANKLGIDKSSSKFVTLTNAAYPKTEGNRLDKNKEICFVGRLSYADKRVDRLLRVWKILENRCEDWSLNIVGDGPELSDLKRLADKLGLKRVSFKGYSLHPETYYSRASIVCMTSTFEGWPMALIEAQANGCVAIAFDCCAGVKEILSPSWENGVLIEPFDIEAYADALTRLMSDDELRNKIAENGFKHVSNFSEERTARQWIEMINNLLQ